MQLGHCKMPFVPPPLSPGPARPGQAVAAAADHQKDTLDVCMGNKLQQHHIIKQRRAGTLQFARILRWSQPCSLQQSDGGRSQAARVARA